MADNRKYYYLKLKENFFDSDSIVLLEDMKDGILYSNILLKLYYALPFSSLTRIRRSRKSYDILYVLPEEESAARYTFPSRS